MGKDHQLKQYLMLMITASCTRLYMLIGKDHQFLSTWMESPFSKQSCVSLLIVVSLLCMDPGHSEDGLIFVQPFQSWESTAVDHSHEPISHSLGSIRVYWLHEWAWHLNIIGSRGWEDHTICGRGRGGVDEGLWRGGGTSRGSNCNYGCKGEWVKVNSTGLSSSSLTPGPFFSLVTRPIFILF